MPKKLICKQCGHSFYITKKEEAYYLKKGLNIPKRCKFCREKNKFNNNEKIEIDFNIITLEELSKNISNNTLYVIGNGFDIYHGVKSSYCDFSRSIGKNSTLRNTLELYVNKPQTEIWGDFEDSLAHIDRGSVLRQLDNFLYIYDVKEEDDDDFKTSSFFLAIDSTLDGLDELIEDLPKRFKSWISALSPKNNETPLKQIIHTNAQFINFNYTEFLETLYDVKKENIIYIHGDRRNRKDTLVLGHGHDSEEMYEQWYEENKPAKISSNDIVSLAYYYDEDEDDYDKWKSPTRYYATMKALERIEQYYDDSAKKTEDVIRKYNNFEDYSNTKTIVTIGHSLSFVDYPYFKKIIEVNNNAKDLQWYISYYSNNDIKRIREFVSEMNIDINQVKVFKLG